ncbi:MAG: DUF1559 domain-containing protein, partial [Planctomycetota bacterium]
GHTAISSGSDPIPSVKYKPVGFKDILDGSSNTLLIMEKSVNQSFYSFSFNGPWSDYWDMGVYHSADWSSMRIISIDDPNDPWGGWRVDMGLRADSELRPDALLESFGRTRELGFGSAHSGVVPATLGDGSTLAVSMNADIFMLMDLGRRSDGGLINFDEL